MQIRIEFNASSLMFNLEDNPWARDLASMLPLRLSIKDFSFNEKIVDLPRRLSEGGRGRSGNEAPGDLCYYVPWGNLALFKQDYRLSNDLILLGKIEGPMDPLLVPGTFEVAIDLVRT